MNQTKFDKVHIQVYVMDELVEIESLKTICTLPKYHIKQLHYSKNAALNIISLII